MQFRRPNQLAMASCSQVVADHATGQPTWPLRHLSPFKRQKEFRRLNTHPKQSPETIGALSHLER